jgi:sugar/nucleoside kinase (ribokinase family)
MKIIIIGHLCIDVTHFENGTETRSIAGIFNSVAALASVASPQDIIVPIFGVGHEEHDEVIEALKNYKNVDPSGIFIFEGKTNHIHFWHFNNAVTDCSKDIAPPISFDAIHPFLNKADGVYVNMQSGSDILLDTLDHIRLEIRSKRIPLYLDLHNVTQGVDPEGKRFRRAMSDWRRWCFMTDFIQMNEEEANGITMDGFSNELLAKQMMPLMVKAFVITRGANGISVYQDAHKHLVTNDIPIQQIEGTVHTVGSGDIFGSIFLYLYLQTKNILSSAERASVLASKSVQYSGSEKFEKLKALAE